MNKTLRIGLIGHGRAGRAIASVLSQAGDVDLRWIVRRHAAQAGEAGASEAGAPPLLCAAQLDWQRLFAERPVDFVVDFSCAENLHAYGPAAATAGVGIVSGVSHYDEAGKRLARRLAERSVVMISPNVTLGINYVLVAAQLLQHLAPFTDIEIIEEHFRDKHETSGTALRLASVLGLDDSKVNSIRVGGIVGRHEVVFGFPHQTVRLSHDSISREAFGTGVLFALRGLRGRPAGLYRYDELVRESMRDALAVPERELPPRRPARPAMALVR